MLNEKQTKTQRLDLLIRQGMLPARQLPILHRALANMKMGKVLTPYERDAMQQLIDKMMDFQFGDDVTFNRARLHTQRTKYQTEESDVEESVDVIIFDGNKDEQEAKRDKKVKKKASKQFKDTDGPGQSNAEEEEMKEEHARGNRPADKEEGDKESPKQGGSVVPPITDGPKQSGKPGAEEPSSHSNTAKVHEGRPSIGEGLLSDLDSEGKRKRDSRRFKRAGKKSKEALLKGMSKSLRKQKMKESVISKEIKAFNDAYKEHLNKSLEDRGVDNIRDIPQETKKEFFDDLDEVITKKHLKQAKGIAFDKRYQGSNYSGAAAAMDKLHPGLSDHPEALKHLKHANEIAPRHMKEGALKDYALGHGYFDKSGEGKRKRDDKDWLTKQSKSKTTLAYPKKKGVTVKELRVFNKSGKVTPEARKKQAELAPPSGHGKGRVEVTKIVKEASAAEIFKKRMKSTHPDDNPQVTKRVDDDKGGMKTYKLHPGAKFQPGNQELSQKGKTAAIRKQHARRPKDYGITEVEDKEEKPLPKTPNQAIRDVHKTVRDVMRGTPDQTVSDVPLVIDPNVELQKETDRLYNNVQESARSDAMRDIKADSKGLAPLKTDGAQKKSKHDGSANKEPEHIVAQLRKAITLGDSHDGVKFKDGKTHKVSAAHAHKFLNNYMQHKPANKEKMQDHAHASHDNFKKHVE